MKIIGTNAPVWGYAFDGTTRDAVAAFQRHFRPAKIDGICDHSTMSTLHALLSSLPSEAVKNATS